MDKLQIHSNGLNYVLSARITQQFMMAPGKALKNILVVILFAIVLANHLVKADDKGCSHFINETGGFVSSPNYPDLYPNSKECSWILELPPGDRIKLVFDSFDLEPNENCNLDFVEVYDGHTVNDPVLGRFCGTNIPNPLTSTTNRMLMIFRTDHSVQHKGFSSSYTRESAGLKYKIRSIDGLLDIERNLTEYLLRPRQEGRSINKWGTDITRTAVALFLEDQRFFSSDNRIGEGISYELSLQLLSKLSLRKRIPTKDLALYINALTVACINPKDFFGIDLVEELRNRVNQSNHTNPFLILTLCNAKDTMTLDDVQQLQQQYDAHFRPVWTDTQAMVVMALSCIYSQSNLDLDERILDEMVLKLKLKQRKNGAFDNLKTTALVVQALLAAENYHTDCDLNAAITFILQEVRRSYPNTKNIYYILPIFNAMSLANITPDHCAPRIKTDLEMIGKLRESSDERIQVQITVILGSDMYFSRTWKIKVPTNYSLYQVLEDIGALEPAYKAQYSVAEGKSYVTGLADFQDDIEEGLFWFIYSKPLSSSESPKRIEQSPADIQVNESDELILWYRSGFWENAEESLLG